MLHWVSKIYSEKNATYIANILEHQSITGPNIDPFVRNATANKQAIVQS